MIEIQKPKIECVDVVDGREMKFVVEPLERGFGTTIGNALRRILLSALPGAAPVSIKIEGVRHEFSSIPGVKEDVTEIILNIKGLAVKAHSDSAEFRQVAKLRKSTAGVVTAADIEHSSEIEILNPDMYICTLDEGAVLNMDITIGNGRGYVPAAANKDETQPIGYIPIDSIFTPVESASYTVESTRLGQNINYDKLTVNVSTNGTCTPREVISLAAKILEDHISLFVNLAPNHKRGTATSTYLTSWDVGIGCGLLLGGYIAQISSFDRAYFVGACLTVVSTLYFKLKVAPHFERNKLR